MLTNYSDLIITHYMHDSHLLPNIYNYYVSIKFLKNNCKLYESLLKICYYSYISKTESNQIMHHRYYLSVYIVLKFHCANKAKQH